MTWRQCSLLNLRPKMELYDDPRRGPIPVPQSRSRWGRRGLSLFTRKRAQHPVPGDLPDLVPVNKAVAVEARVVQPDDDPVEQVELGI